MDDYNPYIKSLKLGEKLFLLRNHVKRLVIKNMPFMEDKKIIFGKYNIIKGKYGRGKSFLINLIYDAYLFGKTELEFFPDIGDYKKINAEINFESFCECKYTFPKKSDSIEYIGWDDYNKKVNLCFMFDQPDLLRNDKERYGFLNYLKGIDSQVIITTDTKKSINYPNEYKIIKI